MKRNPSLPETPPPRPLCCASLDVDGAKAAVFCNINPSDAVQAYAPDPAIFAGEYIAEKIETKAGWTSRSRTRSG